MRPPAYDIDSIVTTRDDRRRPVRLLGVRIVVVSGPAEGAVIRAAGRAVAVGRARSSDLVVGDPAVSSFHAEVSLAEGGFRVKDLGSSNGTYYAGARIADAVVPSGAVLAIGGSTLRIEADDPREDVESDALAFGALRGNSAPMRMLFSALERLAKTDLAVLVEGPTGTGKELVARALHAEGRRARGRFTVLDCTTIPAPLAESVLFGHEKGAFTGAAERRQGVFEAASGGTVFLDEVGELPLELQPKLLRVLEGREVLRVGGHDAVPVDVRVLGATWRDLRAMVNTGAFREDLYYRLVQARVVLPPLADRTEDIPLLVQSFLAQLPDEPPCARAIAPQALAELMRRSYRGNVRELKSTVERAAMIADGPVIGLADLAFERILSGEGAREGSAVSSAPAETDDDAAPSIPFKEAKRSVVEEFERGYLQRLHRRTGGNLSQASRLARIERHHLRDLFRKHGLRGPEE